MIGLCAPPTGCGHDLGRHDVVQATEGHPIRIVCYDCPGWADGVSQAEAHICWTGTEKTIIGVLLGGQPANELHRRFSVEVRAGGDTFVDAARMLEEITREVAEHGVTCQMVQGGPNRGGWVRITEDPTVTAESYAEALRRHVADRRTRG